LLRTAFMK